MSSNRWSKTATTGGLATLRAVGASVLDGIFPPTCLACQIVSRLPLCSDCQHDWDAAGLVGACRRCGRPRAPGAADPCGACGTESFWNVRHVVPVGRYRGVLRDLLLQLKFRGEPSVARWCGAALAECIAAQSWLAEIDAFVPVPMHPIRRCQRAGNHAKQLGEVVANMHRIPLLQPLRRTRMVPSQTQQTSRTQRLQQLRDSFGLRRRSDLAGKTICIVDNVLVSGATLHEVSRTLRKGGAKKIYAVVVGRS